jgi:hypothetical protein
MDIEAKRLKQLEDENAKRVFKVVQALRHAARRKLVRMVENRKGMCHWMAGDALTLRVVVAGLRPTDRSVERIKDQPIRQHAVAFPAGVLEPSGIAA